MRCERQQCRAELELITDRLGRMQYVCRACERRRAGICARCPRPVDGERWKAKYCATCRHEVHRAACRKWQKNLQVLRPSRWEDRLTRERMRQRRKRGYLEPEVRTEVLREAGRKAGKARAAALTPERRREIARKAGQTRWDRQRRKEAARAARR